MMHKVYRNPGYSLLLLATLLGATLPARAQGLPEGEGLQVVVVACTQCHGLDRLTDIRLSATEWENALYDMMARGAIVEEKDLVTIKKYLVDNFAVGQKQKSDAATR